MENIRPATNSPTEPPSTEPGAASQPEGDGPVTLGDRVDGGAPGANQSKTEPMSPTPDHPEPMGAPTLAEMNVGAADPQAPNHRAAKARPPVTQAPVDRVRLPRV